MPVESIPENTSVFNLRRLGESNRVDDIPMRLLVSLVAIIVTLGLVWSTFVLLSSTPHADLDVLAVFAIALPLAAFMWIWDVEYFRWYPDKLTIGSFGFTITWLNQRQWGRPWSYSRFRVDISDLRGISGVSPTYALLMRWKGFPYRSIPINREALDEFVKQATQHGLIATTEHSFLISSNNPITVHRLRRGPASI